MLRPYSLNSSYKTTFNRREKKYNKIKIKKKENKNDVNNKKNKKIKFFFLICGVVTDLFSFPKTLALVNIIFQEKLIWNISIPK